MICLSYQSCFIRLGIRAVGNEWGHAYWLVRVANENAKYRQLGLDYLLITKWEVEQNETNWINAKIVQKLFFLWLQLYYGTTGRIKIHTIFKKVNMNTTEIIIKTSCKSGTHIKLIYLIFLLYFNKIRITSWNTWTRAFSPNTKSECEKLLSWITMWLIRFGSSPESRATSYRYNIQNNYPGTFTAPKLHIIRY